MKEISKKRKVIVYALLFTVCSLVVGSFIALNFDNANAEKQTAKVQSEATSEDVTEAESEAKEAESNLNKAEAELKKAEASGDKEAIAKAKAKVQTAQKSVATAEKKVATVKKSASSTAKKSTSNTKSSSTTAKKSTSSSTKTDETSDIYAKAQAKNENTCKHSWVEQTERVQVGSYIECNSCGINMDKLTEDELSNHIITTKHGGTHREYIYEDKPTGRSYCTKCGATK